MAIAADATYDPATGYFWRDGERADRGRKDGYRRLTHRGDRVLAHRAAFLAMTGEWPAGVVDHINCDPSDNRWINLRVTTAGGNLQNQRHPQRQNKSGMLGVSLHRRGGFYARINVGGKANYLGYFKTAQEAHDAYLNAKRALHPMGTL